jgi:hypothetical protein
MQALGRGYREDHKTEHAAFINRFNTFPRFRDAFVGLMHRGLQSIAAFCLNSWIALAQVQHFWERIKLKLKKL